ncbi:hypothetical protein MsAc7_03190 [Methanolapillus millepedarum]|uniref:Uncharacterized protein n=1 Tax=Methanolapillus millepedarum TaxID=3028296 RepID=A0AA96V1R9_9EURY|nr:hypothetical protein MsAc7_03190 [Methanosarcinaceae archaeon Ac7]
MTSYVNFYVLKQSRREHTPTHITIEKGEKTLCGKVIKNMLRVHPTDIFLEEHPFCETCINAYLKGVKS